MTYKKRTKLYDKSSYYMMECFQCGKPTLKTNSKTQKLDEKHKPGSFLALN